MSPQSPRLPLSPGDGHGDGNVFIGIDFFPLHLAQCLNIYCIGLFGSTDLSKGLTSDKAVGLWADIQCRGCHHRQEIMLTGMECIYRKRRCMKRITSEMVLVAVDKIMKFSN